jgi:hypothetical protein
MFEGGKEGGNSLDLSTFERYSDPRTVSLSRNSRQARGRQAASQLRDDSISGRVRIYTLYDKLDIAELTSNEMFSVERRVAFSEHSKLDSDLLDNSHMERAGCMLDEALKWVVCILNLRVSPSQRHSSGRDRTVKY